MKVVCILFLLGSVCLASDVPMIYHPDTNLTPGVLCSYFDRDYKGMDSHSNERVALCNRRVKRNQKQDVLELYHIDWKNRGYYKIDHIIPLSLGGSNHVQNLFPIHLYLSADYEAIETVALEKYRGGQCSHREAVDAVIKWKFVLWSAEN